MTIPLASCNQATDVLIDWFGPEELKHVVGGERWWQVRGLDGVEGEWLAEREHLDEEAGQATGRTLEREGEDIDRMEKLESVMLYVHGGGYFWGSISASFCASLSLEWLLNLKQIPIVSKCYALLGSSEAEYSL